MLNALRQGQRVPRRHQQGPRQQRRAVPLAARAADGAEGLGQKMTPKITKVTFRWTLPLKSHRKSDNPLEHTTEISAISGRIGAG